MFKLPENVIKATLEYLSTQPYREVVALIQEIMKAEKVEDASPPASNA